ncbi:membrane protein [Armatimonadota bacterium]|nr:membrane protein [Armatimonadota bacterium]
MSSDKMRVVLVMFFAVLSVSIGEALLAKGMKLTNQVTGGWQDQIRGMMTPQVIGGTALMATYFGLYMVALRWADLSFVLPLTALTYLLGAILAKYYLGENVTSVRWAGALIITLGVIIVGFGEGQSLPKP